MIIHFGVAAGPCMGVSVYCCMDVNMQGNGTQRSTSNTMFEWTSFFCLIVNCRCVV